MKYMLDSNTCVFLMKNYAVPLKHYLNEYDKGITVSSITVAELYYGVFNSERLQYNTEKLANFLSGLNQLDFDGTAAVEYGRIRAKLRRQGTPIGSNDILIAAHAKSASLTLITNNTREFERVDGLEIEDWLN